MRIYQFALAMVATVVAVATPHLARAAHFEVVHAFTGGADGQSPEAGLVADKLGNLYGTTFGETGGRPGKNCSKSCGGAYSLIQGDEQVIYTFNGERGSFPLAPLLLHKGYLYGTTEGGGHSDAGTVFRLTPDGTETVVYSFCSVGRKSRRCRDGNAPVAGLIVDRASNFYGTTLYGGSQNTGTVFELSSDGSEKVLYSFCGAGQPPNCPDGDSPLGALVADAAGNLYGTTQTGGTSDCMCGTVFEITTGGTETVLHSFSGADGAHPHSGLTLDDEGNFYGTTLDGGTGNGVVFKLAPDHTETVLHAFTGGIDGTEPFAGVILDNSGNIYGTTANGGGHGCDPIGCGTVFKLDLADGTETILHDFCSLKNCADGEDPLAGLVVQGGYLYGVGTYGGINSCSLGCGVIFKVKKD